METILSTVQRVTVFLIISGLLANLFSGTEYKKYFSYATGLIVIALISAPVLTALGSGDGYKAFLYRAVLDRRAEETEEEIQRFGEKYEDMIRERYTGFIKKDVAEQCGVPEKNCNVVFIEDRIGKISVTLSERPENAKAKARELAMRYGVDEENIFLIY